MAKNRKTRKEKVRASQRQTLPSSSARSEHTSSQAESKTTFSYTTGTPVSPQKSVQYAQSSHLREDLLRTSIVTGAIIVAELILFFTLSLR